MQRMGINPLSWEFEGSRYCNLSVSGYFVCPLLECGHCEQPMPATQDSSSTASLLPARTAAMSVCDTQRF